MGNKQEMSGVNEEVILNLAEGSQWQSGGETTGIDVTYAVLLCGL